MVLQSRGRGPFKWEYESTWPAVELRRIATVLIHRQVSFATRMPTDHVCPDERKLPVLCGTDQFCSTLGELASSSGAESPFDASLD